MNTKDCENITILIDENNIKAIEEIIKSNKSIVKCRDRMGRTLLMYANEEEHLDIAKLLIDSGSEINASDKNGWSALHFSSQNEAFNIIKVLVEHGAKINAKDNNGNTALLNSVYNEKIKDYLISKGADMEDKNNYGVSAKDMINY